MKNILKTLTAIISFTLATNNAMAKNVKSQPQEFVVNGIIVKTNNKLDSKCKIELFNENQLVNETIVKMDKPFEFKLQKNVWYTIRVTKEGFLPLTISFNTEVGNEKIINNVFYFETELIELIDAKFLNPDLIDFPVGVVSVNKETKKFEARDVYTNNYATGLHKTIEKKQADIAKAYVSKREMCDDTV